MIVKAKLEWFVLKEARETFIHAQSKIHIANFCPEGSFTLDDMSLFFVPC